MKKHFWITYGAIIAAVATLAVVYYCKASYDDNERAIKDAQALSERLDRTYGGSPGWPHHAVDPYWGATFAKPDPDAAKKEIARQQALEKRY